MIKKLINTLQSIIIKLTNSYSTRVINTQIELTERALQILAIPEEKRALILDIG
jgi:hypothetical protein